VKLRRQLEIAVSGGRQSGNAPLLLSQHSECIGFGQTVTDPTAIELDQPPVIGARLPQIAIELGEIVVQAPEVRLQGVEGRQPQRVAV